MRKINCDFCNKDISNNYDTVHNEVDAYENKTFDLCEKCLDIYWEIRDKCGKKYDELKRKSDEMIAKEMSEFYHNELKKFKKE